MGSDYINLAEAAEYLRLSRTTVYRLVKSRKLIFYRSGRKFLFLPSDLNKYIRSKKEDLWKEQKST